MIRPDDTKDMERIMERVVRKVLPSILKDQNNSIRRGRINTVNSGAATVDVQIIGTTDMLKGLKFMSKKANTDIARGDLCLVLSPDPGSNSTNFVLIF